MAVGTFFKDGQILWLKVPKVGSPAAWAPGTNYKIGDVVVPTTVIIGLEDYMFQCVGYIGRSGDTQPTFPTLYAATVIDGNIMWTARDPSQAPPKYEDDQYVVIDEQVVVS